MRYKIFYFILSALIILFTLGQVRYQPATEFNVRDFGAAGDGIADDTNAINDAILAAYGIGGGEVILPEGEYLINPEVSVKMMDNTKLILNPRAVLKAKASDKENYAIIKISNDNNIEIIGGRIVGDKNRHLGTKGEQGHGIRITGSNNIRLSDMIVSDCWGDGIYVGSTSLQNYCQNITIEKIRCDNNRRNGLSVISAKDLVIRNCTLSNTNGTNPQAGLCIEPNNENEKMENVGVENLTTINNAGYGINFYVVLNSAVTINITGFKDKGSQKGAYNNYMYENESNPKYQVIFK